MYYVHTPLLAWTILLLAFSNYTKMKLQITELAKARNQMLKVDTLRGPPFNIQGEGGRVLTSELFILLRSTTKQITQFGTLRNHSIYSSVLYWIIIFTTHEQHLVLNGQPLIIAMIIYRKKFKLKSSLYFCSLNSKQCINDHLQ